MDLGILNKIEDIKSSVSEIFKSDTFSENYKQKLVFSLLNSLKSKNKEKFINYLIHAMAAAMKDKPNEVRKVAEILLDLASKRDISDEIWYRLGFAIVLGVMASGKTR